MEGIILILGIINVTMLSTVSANLLNQLNFYASRNQFAQQMFQAPFSMENVIGPSLDMAVQSCQHSFSWQRWNCPSTDFFLRRTSKPLLLDREDAYVTAIATAAILYTITKNCSNGLVAECGCADNSILAQCSDDPAKSEELYHKHVGTHFTDSFADSIKQHNHKAITNLLRKSLVEQCSCRIMGPAGCIETFCAKVLRPFNEIAQDIRHMYDESLQLSNEVINTQVIWKNIPLDAFVYTKDSPNFCEPDAMPGWNGMRGRHCARISAGAVATAEERESCRYLCRACGYRVHTQNAITEKACNCKYTWGGFHVQCDMCVSMETQHYCF